MMVKTALAASALLGAAAALEDIPSFGLGTWRTDFSEAFDVVKTAINLGYNHIDAAKAYNNQETVGEAMADARLELNDFWITSKLWNDAHKGIDVIMGIEDTMGELMVTRTDLYLVHWPVAFKRGTTDLDPSVSLVHTWKQMEVLVRAGRTRKIGVSNFSPADLEAILDVCEICPYAHEFELHPYLQQQAFVDWHLERGIKVIAYSPLANTNGIYEGIHPEVRPLLEDPFWVDLAGRKNATVAQAALAWGLQRGTVVIPKATRREHLAENLGALDVVFTEEEMKEIAGQDKKIRFNNPGREWGVELFKGLDDSDSL
jgi:alcohol dehydrogenase (NADP+)